MDLKKFAYIKLPNPDAFKKDLHMSMEEAKRARLYFRELVNRYYISVKRPTPGMEGGACHHSRTTIYVPTIRNKSHFYLCLHEIGHVHHQPTSLDMLLRGSLGEAALIHFSGEASIIDEYNAETFALEHAQSFGLDTAVYEKHAKRYVFKYVQKIHQKGTDWAALDERVRDIATKWLGITEADWLAQEWRLVG